MSSSPAAVARVPDELSLEEGEFHLWCAPLTASAGRLAALRQSLDGEERQRADRFRFDRHRRRFTVSHALMRRVLAAYTGRKPSEIRFSLGRRGKPFLDPPHAARPHAARPHAARPHAARLELNLSHSHELMLLGLTWDLPLGVDVERLRPMPDAAELAERFFSPAEARALGEVPAARRSAAFLRGWTRKEAYVKAVGDGLTLPLDRFDVTLDEPARFLRLDGSAGTAARWTLYHLDPAPGYVGAAACLGPARRLRAWYLDPESGQGPGPP